MRPYLTEGYKNLFTTDQKSKFADEAFELLQSSYAKLGGIHGSGFKNPKDLIANIPFWKIKLDKSGKICAGAFYKDKNGRKRVAIATDGSVAGKKAAADIIVSDLKQNRSYGEVSGPSLSFLVKLVGVSTVKDYAIDPSDLEEILGDEVFLPDEEDAEILKHPELAEFFYSREIGGSLHTKIALGTPKKSIT